MTFRSRLLKFLAYGTVLAVVMSASGQVSTYAQQTEPISSANAIEINEPRSLEFVYQGEIKKNGTVVTGTCDFNFGLWDAANSGENKGRLTVSGVAVTNGKFTATLDFGDQFTGDARWIETSIKCSDDTTFTTMPRQKIYGAPYANGLWAGTSIRGSHPSAAFTTDNAIGAGIAGYSHGSNGNSWGVFGYSENEYGVHGTSTNGSAGVLGDAMKGHGVQGISHAGSRSGVYGYNDTTEPYAAGVAGEAPNGNGVYGSSTNFAGGYFYSQNGIGAFAESANHDGIQGISHAADHSGVYGANDSPNGFAGFFDGKTWTRTIEIAGGADLVEKFDVTNDPNPEPGTLLVIDEANPGKLKPSAVAYDTKVAGIVSGAGDVKPGLVLHQDGVLGGNTQVAIAGRVYVKAEALSGAIKPGDLLTTSHMAGYAMQAANHELSQGAIIGKAMTGLQEGTGLVLVLVNLQ